MKIIDMKTGPRSGEPGLDAAPAGLSGVLAAALADLETALNQGIEAEPDRFFRLKDGKLAGVSAAGAAAAALSDQPGLTAAYNPQLLAERGFCTRRAADQLTAVELMTRGSFAWAYDTVQGFGRAAENSKHWSALKLIERIVEEGWPAVDPDWSRIDPACDFDANAPQRLVPWGMMLFFKEEVLPAMRLKGL